MTTHNHDTRVLNTLIATTLDSMKGYREAAEDSETSYATFFCDMADERSRVASAMQAQVAAQGGDPEDDSTLKAAAHRGFMNLKQALTGKDEKAIVGEVEHGEDYIKAKFEEALKDNELSAAARQVIEQAYTSVRSGHDKVSALKHSMAAA